MELAQDATCTGPKFVLVSTCTCQPLQVATCTSCLYITYILFEIRYCVILFYK